MSKFIHLNVKSDNSLLEGFGKISDYIKKLKKIGQDSMALTDHGTMTGIYDFIKQCQKNGIKPIPGIEMNIAPINPLGVKNKESVMYSDKQIISGKGTYTRLTILAKNNIGLQNLFKLSKISYELENCIHGNIEDIPRIDLEILKEHKDGLIVLSGVGDSEINIRFRLGQDEKAYEFASILKEVFQDDFYIEVFEGKFVNGYNFNKLLKLAKDLNIKPVLTNNVHYVTPEDSQLQEEIMCIGKKSKMIETPTYKGGLRPAIGGNDRYLKSFNEMNKIFPYEEYHELYNNILEIENKIETFKLEYNNHLRPTIKIPEEFKSNVDFIKHIIKDGFKKKRGHQSDEIKQESKRRLNEELNVIIANDFVNYFLVVWDYCKFAEDNGYPIGPGRGSCAGSEVAFLMNITKTDPIRFDLLFERFISPGRGAVYEIEFEDGSKEIMLVSDKHIVNGEQKYTYELEVGMEI